MRRIDSTLISHFYTITKFAVVGAVTAVIYFLVMWIIVSIFKYYYIVGISIAYFVSTIFHFLANRHFTFGAAGDRHWHQLIRYLVMWIFNYFVTIAVVGVCVERFLLSPYVGVCISIVFTMITGYVLSRYWVFRNKG